jgi:hypothetical protein
MKHFFLLITLLICFLIENKKNENFTQKNDIFKTEVIAK